MAVSISGIKVIMYVSTKKKIQKRERDMKVTILLQHLYFFKSAKFMK